MVKGAGCEGSHVFVTGLRYLVNDYQVPGQRVPGIRIHVGIDSVKGLRPNIVCLATNSTSNRTKFARRQRGCFYCLTTPLPSYVRSDRAANDPVVWHNTYHRHGQHG